MYPDYVHAADFDANNLSHIERMSLLRLTLDGRHDANERMIRHAVCTGDNNPEAYKQAESNYKYHARIAARVRYN